MAKGKQASQPTATTSTVTQTNLPEYAAPYVTDVMSRAQGLSYRPYEAYPGPRVAGFNGDQYASFNAARGMTGLGDTQYNSAESNINQARGLYSQPVSVDQVSTQMWSPAAANQYMDPYITNVMDTVLSRNEALFGRDQLQRNSRASMSGAFGGLRQGVEDGVARGEFGRSTAEREAAMMSDAYRTAFQGFTSDQARGLQASMANQGANLEGQRLVQSQAAGLSGLGGQMAALGDTRRAAGLQNYQLLRDVGLDQQRQVQAGYDVANENFINQRDYDWQNLNRYNSVVRGMPMTANSNTVQYEQSNPYSQWLGLGLGATGLVNALNGGQA